MVSPNRIAEVGAVVGDPARAVMLSVLRDDEFFCTRVFKYRAVMHRVRFGE
jgi:hypothetical protein